MFTGSVTSVQVKEKIMQKLHIVCVQVRKIELIQYMLSRTKITTENSREHSCLNKITVFRISDILVRIRILLFSLLPRRHQHKKFSPLCFYGYSFLKVHLYHSSKIKSHKKSQKRRNQGFSSFFAC
jgi:hypothetical protein